jgi:uncharacterized cupin superfamily protein
MSDIAVEHAPGEASLKALGAHDWPIWTQKPSQFPGSHKATETCHPLEG